MFNASQCLFSSDYLLNYELKYNFILVLYVNGSSQVCILQKYPPFIVTPYL